MNLLYCKCMCNVIKCFKFMVSRVNIERILVYMIIFFLMSVNVYEK